MTDETEALGIRVVSGAPTDADLAAVHAVLGAAVQEASDDSHRVQEAGPSAWDRSQRAVRMPLRHGAGAWQSFGA